MMIVTPENIFMQESIVTDMLTTRKVIIRL